MIHAIFLPTNFLIGLMMIRLSHSRLIEINAFQVLAIFKLTAGEEKRRRERDARETREKDSERKMTILFRMEMISISQ